MASTRGINNRRICQKLEIIFAPLSFAVIGAQVHKGNQYGSTISICDSRINCHHHENKRGRIIINPIFKRQNRSTKVGTGTISSGEAGLILAAVGITSGALTYDIDKAIIIMVALTTIVAPIWFKRTYSKEFPKNKKAI
jgi:hypothetical protein